MITDLPVYISLIFGLTTFISIVWFAAAAKSRTFILLILCWTTLQSLLGLKGIFQDTAAMPPRLMLFGIFPALITIIITFLTPSGRNFIDNINLKRLTYFNTIRLGVEIVLVLLFQNKLIPVYMTFEGTNFDIFSGISAPLIGYLAFRTAVINKKLLLGWNILCLLLLLNVVITAILAIPTPFQKIALEQPNVAVLFFPFNLLATVVVPLVFLGHMVAIRQLTK